jgi:Prokaryotic lipoprotein-attachment site
MKYLIGAVMLCLALSACGRRGAPSPPGPAADITYPHVYPAQ